MWSVNEGGFINTSTFWADWLGRLDRVLSDANRLLGNLSTVSSAHLPSISQLQRRLVALVEELKMLNRGVIGADSQDGDHIHGMQSALETAVLHIDKLVSGARGDMASLGDARSITMIKKSLREIDYEAAMLVRPIMLSA